MMLINYIKSAIRHFTRDKLYSSINILGLALGIASCIICYLHINYELSYDQFHSKKNQIYRVVKGNLETGQFWAAMSARVPPKLKQEFPEVREYARLGKFSWDPKTMIKYDNKAFYEDHFLLADPSFFKLFDFKFIEGNPETALSSVNSVVITQSNAKKYFGDKNPIGKVINADGKFDYQISGVIEDPPFNSHLDFDFLISFENLDLIYWKRASESWGAFNYHAYLLVEKATNINELSHKIKSINFTLDNEKEISFQDVSLQPLSDIHFMQSRGNQKPAYDLNYIYIFIAIAIAVLIIASINFINLTTAKSQQRIKETGVRKTIGASRKQLILQFITESIVTSFFALLVALILLHLLLPSINQILENKIDINYSNPGFLLSLTLITVFIGLLSGSYIAFYITSFSPVKVLKGKIKVNSGDITLRKALLIFQFGISSILIVCSIIIVRQLNMIHNQDIGIKKENVLNLSVYGKEAQSKISLFKQEVQKIPEVISAAASSFVPGYPNYNQTVWWEGQEKSEQMYLIPCDENFIQTMNLELTEGKLDEIQNIPEDEYTYVLNQAALKFMGWERGYRKQFSAYGKNNAKTIAGVVKDFNYRSLHFGVEPLALIISNRSGHDQISIRIAAGQYKPAIPKIKKKFNEIMPSTPFEYKFLDDQFEQLYKSELRAGKIISFLTIISILIALFGVYGLASFAIKERTKEIAVRKVFGINMQSLVGLLTKDLMLLLLMGNLIAWPAAWYLMKNWLENFSYKTPLHLGVFAIATLVVMTIVFITIGIKAVRSARVNVSSELRYE
ncbi:MAG: ABC transporter permease [Bacteroidales bacterium]|jgi:putative ABC transport system permease protein|nr:ABC transporter permease [Bacteroidales bacterium]